MIKWLDHKTMGQNGAQIQSKQTERLGVWKK